MNSGILSADSYTTIIAVLVLVIFAMVLIFIRHTKKVERASTIDSVTGALNVLGFSKAVDKFKKENRPYALVVMELKNFRQIRRTYGAAKSGHVLVHLLTVLRSVLSTSEPIARIGTRTFCFLVRNREQREIRARLARIYENANRFNKNKRDPYPLDLCFAVYIPDGTEELYVMQERAMEMLEQTADESRYRFYKKPAEADTKHSAPALVQQMEQSLKNGDFIVNLQPKIRLGDDRIVGAEAIIRWRHPQHGFLDPDQFIPQLQEYHVTHRVERYVFECICKKQAQWRTMGRKPCPISMNVSSESIAVDNFLESCLRLTKQYNVSPKLFEFELNTPRLAKTPNKLITTIDEIHNYGFQCALDYFDNKISLDLLPKLDVDSIKLSSTLFSAENNTRRNRFVIEAVLKIAAQMHIRTIATGIRDESALKYLRQSACDIVQSPLYLKSLMTMDEFQNVAYEDGELRYIIVNAGGGTAAAKKNDNESNIVMFSYLPSEDSISFSSQFSPLLSDSITPAKASDLFERSDFVHPNDMDDLRHLFKRCKNEGDWISGAVRFLTAVGKYEIMIVHVHCERLNNSDEMVISGTLVNMNSWAQEVDNWKNKAHRDALTGIYNREYFEQNTAATLASDNITTGAVVFIDIDDFKMVNDTLGHMVGDDVLCCVAKRILGVFRHTDIVARYGGDEFVVFVNGISRKDLENRLLHLCEVFRHPYRNDTIEYKISGSIGAAMFPDDGSNYEDLLEHADTALYAAKGRGKDQFALYYPAMESTVVKDK